MPKGKATSTPLPARLILVTKPNVHGGPARKKARIVICGNFQEVHPDAGTFPLPFCMLDSLEIETQIWGVMRSS